MQHKKKVIQIDSWRGRKIQPAENATPNPPGSPCVPNRITPSHRAIITRAFHGLRRGTRWLQVNNKPLKLVEIENVLRDDRDELMGQLRSAQDQVRRLMIERDQWMRRAA